MRYHIVRTTDTIDRIASIYNMTIQEIKNSNEHISDWRKLIPGTKIRLPAIPDHVRDELEDTEPFIEDYYPKLKIQDDYENIIEEENNEIEIEPNNDFNVIEESNVTEEQLNVVEEDEKHIEEIIEKNIENNYNRQNNHMIYRYIYPQPYYYRPIVYVIPRR